MRLPLAQAQMSLPARSLAFAALLIGQPMAVAVADTAVDCVITPFLTVDVASAAPGVIDKVYVERGDQVEQNQVVAMLDADVEKAAVDIAEARSTMVSEVMLGRVNMDYDKRKQERLSSLHGQNAISTQDKDEAERSAKAAKLKLQHARDLHQLRQLELRKAEEELRQRNVRSPIQGVVVQRFKYSAEYVEDQPIMRIAQLDPLHIEAIVPMEMFGKIQVGMSADVFPEIVSDEARQAKVTVVDSMGDAASGTFGVRLTMDNPANALPAGIKCHAQFDLNSKPKQLAAASEPVTPQPLRSDETATHRDVMQLAMLDEREIATQTDALDSYESIEDTTEGGLSIEHQQKTAVSGQYDDDINGMPKVWLKRPAVNVRAEPNQRAAIIRKAEQSDSIYKIEEVQGWFKVYLPEKDTVGYMAGFLLGEMTDAWQP
ncbi:MAG: efflux RND transporter periplasmic adaptor subunit [Gammaproteobacteria bacterium]|nr:efflux RND transporter periplasmic adaptor subunit [Gammaproteobacteria bacterium]